MVRYLLSGVVMVGAVVVFLAGALGNVASLPDLSAVLSNSIARVLPDRPQVPTSDLTPAAPPPAASSDAGAAQPVIEALNQQLSQLQQQVDQRAKELDALRADANAEQRKLTTIQQQREAEEAAVAQARALHQQLEGAQKTVASTAFAEVAQQKAANAALQKESADLQAQIKLESDQLASLRSNEDQERHSLDTLYQQRRAAEDAVGRLQSQREQLAAAQASPPVSAPPPHARPPAPASHATTSDTMQSAVAQLRAKEREVPPPPARPVEATSLAPRYAPSSPQLIIATKGVLISARELVASGRPAEARQMLMKAQAAAALHPVTPGQPYATGGSSVATQIGAAIGFLDAGNSVRALQAINSAMDNVGSTASGVQPDSANFAGAAPR
jgi:hypothetical protein